ncbi:MAG TPA: hypothetical protein VKK79_07825 [Candidatus Lokiarchaeia archaeon]|nr:hypothetical protein [Candidatus Lokiarchaeia archaeon]
MVTLSGKQCPAQDVDPDQEEFLTCPFAGEAMCPNDKNCIFLYTLAVIPDEDDDDDESDSDDDDEEEEK